MSNEEMARIGKELSDSFRRRFGWWGRFVPLLWKVAGSWMAQKHFSTPLGLCLYCGTPVYPGPRGYTGSLREPAHIPCRDKDYQDRQDNQEEAG